MRIVFAGTPEVAVPSLQAVVAAGHEVLGVITRTDAPLGRRRVLTASPVAIAAEKFGIPVLKTNQLAADETSWVQNLQPDLGVVVAYGGLLREEMLTTPEHGWINLHFSDLPRWRGAAPVQRALMAGETELGITVFRLVRDLDAGAVLTRDKHKFRPATPAGEALGELAELGTEALLRAVKILEHDPHSGDPQVGETSYAHKLNREDGKLYLSGRQESVLAHWAGVTPEPGAYAECDGVPLKLLVLRATEHAGLQAGETAIIEKQALLGTGDRAVVLERVQPAGKPPMDGASWLRGRSEETVLL